MALPSNNTLIDDFNRASLGPLWTASYGVPRIVSNQFAPDLAVQGAAYRNDFTVVGDVELNLPFTVASPGYSIGAMILRAGAGSVDDGYIAYGEYNSGSPVTTIYRLDNGVFTQLGADISVPWANGDRLGMARTGNLIECYRKPSGSSTWSLVGSRTDATYGATTTWYVGLDASGNSANRVDEFRGGAPAPSKSGAVTLTGTGALVVAGNKGSGAATTTSVNGTIAVDGRRGAAAAVSVAGAGEATAVGSKRSSAPAAITAATAIAATGARTGSGVVVLTAAGYLDCNGRRATAGSVAVAGHAEAVTAGVKAAASTVTITGSGNVTVEAVYAAEGAVSIAGRGDALVEGHASHGGSVTVSGASDAAAAGDRGAAAETTVDAAGVVTATGRRGARAAVSITTTASTLAEGWSARRGQSHLFGPAAITAAGRSARQGDVALSGSGQVHVVSFRRPRGFWALPGHVSGNTTMRVAPAPRGHVRAPTAAGIRVGRSH